MPDPDARAAWVATRRAQAAVARVLEAELQRDCGLPWAWYEVLVELGPQPAGTMRMNELADAVLISRSWLTRSVDAMAAAGLVERCAAAGDRRGICLRLTREGKQALTRAERAQARSIRRHVACHLDAADVPIIETAMARVDAAARQAIAGSAG